MFIRLAFLLLLANLAFIESLKVQTILKDVGKRFSNIDKVIRGKKFAANTGIFGLYMNNANAYRHYPEKAISDIKNQTSRVVKNNFIEASSSENFRFQDALLYIESIMLSDFTAEVCGVEQKMNSYQYMKYLTHSASQHKGYFVKVVPSGFEETDRDSLKFNLDLMLKDKMDVDVKMEFEFTMKTSFSFTNTRFFYLASIVQGGTCADKGVVGHTNSEFQGIDSWIEDVEGLKQKPTTKLFLKLFTPRLYQYLEENPNKLPRYWLSGINSTLTKINVCHEKVTDSVEYTEDQFRSWYAQFGLMWHPKEGFENQTYSLQLIELLDDSITAKITMKLQMGRDKDAELHDWDFKMLAKKNEYTWYIDRIEVLCDPTIEYKDQSLKLIRDVVAGKFVDELKYQNDTQWYSTVEFMKQFTKHGTLEMTDCVKDTVQTITQIDLFKKDEENVHGIKFTKYQIDDEIELPAADTAQFRFKTVSQAADSTEETKVETEHEWLFDIKWDQMDQFYYLEKMGIGCPTGWTVKGVFKSILDAFGR